MRMRTSSQEDKPSLGQRVRGDLLWSTFHEPLIKANSIRTGHGGCGCPRAASCLRQPCQSLLSACWLLQSIQQSSFSSEGGWGPRRWGLKLSVTHSLHSMRITSAFNSLAHVRNWAQYELEFTQLCWQRAPGRTLKCSRWSMGEVWKGSVKQPPDDKHSFPNQGKKTEKIFLFQVKQKSSFPWLFLARGEGGGGRGEKKKEKEIFHLETFFFFPIEVDRG